MSFLRSMARMFGGQAYLSDFLPWARPIDETEETIATRWGGLMRCAKLTNPDAAAATKMALKDHHDRLTSVLEQYGDGWQIAFDMWRLKVDDYLPESDFGSLAGKLIDDTRRERFTNGSRPLFDLSAFVSVHLMPQRNEDILTWLEGREDVDIGHQKRYFLANSDKFFERLSHVVPGVTILRGDNLASYLESTVSYEPRCVPMPEGFLYSELSTADWRTSPRIIIGNRHMATVEVRNFGRAEPLSCAGIMSLPFPWRWTATYAGLSKEARRKRLADAAREWKSKANTFGGMANRIIMKGDGSGNVNVEALSNHEKMLFFRANQAQYPICDATVNFTVWGDTQKEADSRAQIVETTLGDSGVISKKATLNDFNALAGDLPGMVGGGIENLRKRTRIIGAVTRLMPWAGSDTGPAMDGLYEAPALMMGDTRDQLPYRFVINAPGSDLGHGMILGQSGAGKSTIANFMAAQGMKYQDSRVVFWDRDEGSLVTCLCLGGEWVRLGGNGIGVQPLRHIDDAEEFVFWHDWLMAWLELQGVGVSDVPNASDAITIAMQHVAELPPDERTISRLWAYLSESNRVAQAINILRKGQGPYGAQYDGVVRSYGFSRFIGFETTDILERKDTPLMAAAVFRRIDRDILNGRQPTLFFADEFKFMIEHPVLAPKFAGAVMTARKRKASLFMATQSPGHLDNPHGREIMRQMATRIFLPDKNITEEDAAAPYLRLGFSYELLRLVASGTPKSEYIIQTRDVTKVVSFRLEGAARAICGANTPADRARAYDILDRGVAPGDDFTREWLQESTNAWVERVGFKRRKTA